jgi:hypothetical protein
MNHSKDFLRIPALIRRSEEFDESPIRLERLSLRMVHCQVVLTYFCDFMFVQPNPANKVMSVEEDVAQHPSVHSKSPHAQNTRTYVCF